MRPGYWPFPPAKPSLPCHATPAPPRASQEYGNCTRRTDFARRFARLGFSRLSPFLLACLACWLAWSQSFILPDAASNNREAEGWPHNSPPPSPDPANQVLEEYLARHP